MLEKLSVSISIQIISVWINWFEYQSRESIQTGSFMFLKINKTLCELFLYKPSVTHQQMLLSLNFFFPYKTEEADCLFCSCPINCAASAFAGKGSHSHNSGKKRLLSQRNHECSPFLSKGAPLCPDSPHSCSPPASPLPPSAEGPRLCCLTWMWM